MLSLCHQPILLYVVYTIDIDQKPDKPSTMKMEFVPESLLYECIYNRIYTDILCQTRAPTFIQLKPAVCCYSNYIFVQLRDRNRIEANKKKYNDEEKRTSRIYRRLEESVCVCMRAASQHESMLKCTFVMYILHLYYIFFTIQLM